MCFMLCIHIANTVEFSHQWRFMDAEMVHAPDKYLTKADDYYKEFIMWEGSHNKLLVHVIS